MFRKYRLFSFGFCLILTFPLFNQFSSLLSQLQTGASLYISPASGTHFVGSTFDVSIYVNTGGRNINAAQVDLQFPPDKLQVASPTTGSSLISVWVSQPTYSNTKGTISFIGGLPSPGINTSSGLVSTITFRAKAPGLATLSFKDSSQILLADGQGTNILNSVNEGKYNLVIPPPEGPKVFSPTHADQNKWHQDNNPTFSWESDKDVTDFSFILDENPQGAPDNSSEGGLTSISYTDLSDGLWYFHVKARRTGSWGGTSHFPVRIDSTPPADFKPKIEPSKKTSNHSPLIFFVTTDALSGLDYYEVKIVKSDSIKEETSFFTEQTSPYRVSIQEIGSYNIVVRAYDLAGNYREVLTELEIVLPGQEGFWSMVRDLFTKDSFWFYSVIIIILFLVGLFFLVKHIDKRQTRILLQKEIKEVREALEKGVKVFGEDIEEKLSELEAIASSNRLTLEQKRKKEELIENLSILKKYIQKEIEDVEEKIR